MKEQKEKSQGKKIIKERETLEKKLKPLEKRNFACEEDARLEIQKLAKDIQKLTFHQVTFDINEIPKRKPGRPSKNMAPEWVYQLMPTMKEDHQAIQDHLIRECTFVLVSNDTSLTAEALLKEYKTQSQTEKKFQQLKSPHFVKPCFWTIPAALKPLPI